MVACSAQHQGWQQVDRDAPSLTASPTSRWRDEARQLKAEAYGPGIEQNLLHVAGAPPTAAKALSRISGADHRSLGGDALFVDEAACDYRVRDASPALKIGFVNFDTRGYGVRSERLRRIAKTPILPGSPEETVIVNRGWGQSKVLSPHKKSRKTRWLGAVIRNIRTEGEKSAAGLDAIRGVLVLRIEKDSPATRIGLKEGDVILNLDGRVDDVRILVERFRRRSAEKPLALGIWRNQEAKTLRE